MVCNMKIRVLFQGGRVWHKLDMDYLEDRIVNGDPTDGFNAGSMCDGERESQVHAIWVGARRPPGPLGEIPDCTKCADLIPWTDCHICGGRAKRKCQACGNPVCTGCASVRRWGRAQKRLLICNRCWENEHQAPDLDADYTEWNGVSIREW